MKDKHLKCYFKKSNTKKQLMVIKQVRVVDDERYYCCFDTIDDG